MDSKSVIQYLFSTFSILVLLLLLADTIFGEDMVSSLLWLSSTTILSVFLIVVWIMKAQSHDIPKVVWIVNNWVVLPVSLLFFLVLSYIDYNSTVNNVYDTIGIYYQQLGVVVLGSFSFAVVCAETGWDSLKERMGLLIVPFFLMIVFLVMDTWPFNYFVELNKEDHLIEWTQFVVVLLSSVLAYNVSRQLSKAKLKLLSWSFIIIALGLFVVAGEEISWGQRILSIETPEAIAEINTQDEITIHNLEPVAQYIWQAYLILSLFGTFAWIFQPWLRSVIKKPYSIIADLYIPPWFTVSYFLFPLIYHIKTRPGIEHGIGRWAETVELFLYLGVAIYIWHLQYVIPENTDSKRK